MTAHFVYYALVFTNWPGDNTHVGVRFRIDANEIGRRGIRDAYARSVDIPLACYYSQMKNKRSKSTPIKNEN